MPDSFPIEPKIIRWAVERSGLSSDVLATRFPSLDAWQRGERVPSQKQLQEFARTTMVPLGYLFLSEPPVETISLPDYRTVSDGRPTRPSPNLIETVQTMQRRQEWMRDFLLEQGHEPLPFVGGGMIGESVASITDRIRTVLHLRSDWARACQNWEEALRVLRHAIEDAGILMATSGIVGLSTKRKLEPREFRGFVLCDDHAPLIFVNGADAKSAQMFTIAHELAHIWLRRDGLFNLIGTLPSSDATERFCNQAAAEFLLPGAEFHDAWARAGSETNPYAAIAREYKVSPIVAARRAFDLGVIAKTSFLEFYDSELTRWRNAELAKKQGRQGGPSFYDVQDVRLGRRFAQAVVHAVQESRLSFRTAYQLTGLRGATFRRYSRRVLDRVKNAQP